MQTAMEILLSVCTSLSGKDDKDSYTTRKCSDHHYQISDHTTQDKPVIFAEWWPSKGTTRADGKNGPKCHTAEQLLVWLRDL